MSEHTTETLSAEEREVLIMGLKGGGGCWDDEPCCRASFTSMTPAVEAIVARRERAAAERALREAADQVRRVRTQGLLPGEIYGPASEAFEYWLRARAAAAAEDGPR